MQKQMNQTEDRFFSSQIYLQMLNGFRPKRSLTKLTRFKNIQENWRENPKKSTTNFVHAKDKNNRVETAADLAVASI